MSLGPGTRLGPYEIVSAIGAGGMGEVYRARDTRLDRTVAIKVLPAHVSGDPVLRERFEREARTVAALNHPRICTLHDVGHQDGIDFLVLEYLDGETLAQRLAKGALPLDQAVGIAIQIAGALDKAHRAGIVHRDLKPGNIMLTKSGAAPQAKLLDFGLAKVTPAVVAASGLSMAPTGLTPVTMRGSILGTLQYMAPEQVEGQEADARTDIFAFGCVLYEMLTGKKAFEGKTQASLLSAILKDTPRAIMELLPIAPAALDRLVRKCLAKDPEERWQSAKDLHDELVWVRDAGAGTAVAATHQPTSRTRGRQTALVALAALVGAAVAAGAVWTAIRPSTTTPAFRFSVPAPAGANLSGFALSPDGRHLAFVANEPGKQPMLYVRPLDAIAAKPIAGTEGARNPFWSPDSRSIGFFANSRLKTVDAAGGSVRTICDAVGLRTWGDWNRDGVILFSTEGKDPIRRVSADGGQPVAVTRDDPQGGGIHPAFLPDGHHFLYYSGSPSNGEIHRGSIDGADDVLVTTMSGWGTYAAPGYLVFVRGADLVAQAFDPDRGTLSGRPVTIGTVGAAYSTGVNTTDNGFSISANGVLALRTLDLNTDSELAWFSRTGQRLSTLATPGVYRNVQLSPDGLHPVFEQQDEQTGRRDVWTIDPSRGVKTRLTLDGADVHQLPVWSPDGSSIIYRSTAGRGVMRLPADGNGTEQQVSETSFDPNSYSPDGRYLVFTVLNPQTNRDVGILPLFGDRKPFLFLHSTANEVHGHVSPDGNWIAYASDESGGAGDSEIYIQRFPGGGQKIRVSTGGGDQARWRHDGHELFYLSRDNRLMSVAITFAPELKVGTPAALFVTKAVGGGGIGTNANYDVSADGQRFIIASQLTDPDVPPITVVTNWSATLQK